MADKIRYPEMIERLPDIDSPNPGVRGKLFQGEGLQAVFFSVETTGEIAPHQHQAQWGVVLEGELLMTLDGVTQKYRRGDSYFIPAGVTHSAKILSPVKVLEFFDEPARYRAKNS
ncbi:MAG: cupin domain-containing protein [Desulfobacteraceae bacterium]|nr:MAG: cupin domain-containing protein [Desulfobacteraceae bacterium]